MKTDAVLKNEGLRILCEHLGMVDAERFIALMIREPFDYTEWRKTLGEGMTLREVSERAMQYRCSDPEGRHCL